MSIQSSAPTTPAQPRVPAGVAAAAIIAAGIGCLALGVFTTLAEVSPAVKNGLNWYDPVGPLAGKTGLAYAVWLVSWVVLHTVMKAKESNFGKAYITGLILIALGLVGTFPTFFEAFSAH